MPPCITLAWTAFVVDIGDRHYGIVGMLEGTPMRFLKLRIAFSASCAVIGLLIAALWVRSYFTFDRLSGRCTARTPFLVVVSYAGRLTAIATDQQRSHWNGRKWDSGPLMPHNTSHVDLKEGKFTWKFSWNNTDVLWPERGILGFGWISKTMYLNLPNGEVGWNPLGLTARSWGGRAAGCMLPHWFAFTAFASLAAAPWIQRRFSMRTLLIIITVAALVLWAAIYSVG